MFESSHEMAMQMPLKFVLVGDQGVGKSSLSVAYGSKEFHEVVYSQTLDNYSGKHFLDGRNYDIHLWDTCGTDEYKKLRLTAYPWTNAFLLCFALDEERSFDNIFSNWLPELEEFCTETPIILEPRKISKTIRYSQRRYRMSSAKEKE